MPARKLHAEERVRQRLAHRRPRPRASPAPAGGGGSGIRGLRLRVRVGLRQDPRPERASPPPRARSGRRGCGPGSPRSSRRRGPRPPAAPRSPWARWPGTSPAPAARGGRAARSSDLRLLVEAGADPVAHELPHHRVAVALGGVCTAWPMSPTRLPGRQASMPANRDSRVAVMRRVASGLACPTATVRAASPKKPSTMQPRSRPTMSPSRSLRGPGDAVDDLLVHRDAQRRRVAAVAQERRARPRLLDVLARDPVHLLRGDPGHRGRLERVEGVDHDPAGARHRLELAPGLLDAHAGTSTACEQLLEHHVHRPVAVDRDHPRAGAVVLDQRERALVVLAGAAAPPPTRGRPRAARAPVPQASQTPGASAGRSSGGRWPGRPGTSAGRRAAASARGAGTSKSNTTQARGSPPVISSSPCAWGSVRGKPSKTNPGRSPARRCARARGPPAGGRATRFPFSISGWALLPERRVLGDRGPEHLARPDLRDPQVRGEPRRLRALPRPRGAEEDHADGVRGPAGASGVHEFSCLPGP